MAGIVESVKAYEAWMSRELRRDVVKDDVALKHKKLRESPFIFLRGTYWRWAETILEVCPDLAKAASVLAVGDIHLENFGTWRDAEGRLVWGVNDFDEAARMPYALDLVRLATSALLASPDRRIGTAEICAAILEGYRQGLREPQPIVLDRDWAWLREMVVVSEKQRAKFWSKIGATSSATAPASYGKALAQAMPQPKLDIRTSRRTAGTGSLGRPRWVGVADWYGAPVVREAKAVLLSGWALARGKGRQPIRCGEIADGRYRAKDPWYRQIDSLIVRRLSPNNRKIEAEEGISLMASDVLRAMGLDLANVHMGTANRRDAVAKDLGTRKSDWLVENAKLAAAAVVGDFKDWRAG